MDRKPYTVDKTDGSCSSHLEGGEKDVVDGPILLCDLQSGIVRERITADAAFEDQDLAALLYALDRVREAEALGPRARACDVAFEEAAATVVAHVGTTLDAPLAISLVHLLRKALLAHQLGEELV
ncbi:MAG: hypothetical protein UHS51_05410 [Atopobiaceae bacterium]|nr:hypothetical protein [Atopobiaceae bacterium]